MYDDLQTVAHTVDAAGFVLVGGQRVPSNNPGKMLRSCASYKAHCQLCAQVNVTIPQRLVSQFEHAIGAVRYFHASPVGAFNDYRLCVSCKERP